MTRVQITDVFLRDGLQDESVFVSPQQRIALGRELVDAGIPRIEAGSFVSDRRVPQMAGAAEVLAGLNEVPRANCTVLALNGRGVERAVSAGASSVSLAVSASESHSRENAGRGTAEVIEGLARVVAEYPGITFDAAVSTAFTCPYEGEIPVSRLAAVVAGFLEMGIRNVWLADTLGNTPTERVTATLRTLREAHPQITVGLHLHNAAGQAIETALAAVELGVQRFDAALAGFGGCPFAPGAAGNVATEQLVGALHAAGHTTGVDVQRLTRAAELARRLVAEGAPLAH